MIGVAGEREALIRSGLEVMTETGYLSAGIKAIIKGISVPKGSFYHCFKSKEAFGMAVLAAYGTYFACKLDNYLLDNRFPSLQRLQNFITHAGQGMAKYKFKRGCLVGNLLQETPQLPEQFPQQLRTILADWEGRVAARLRAARQAAQIPCSMDPPQLARIFWSGWEGAVMRVKLFRSTEPLEQFGTFFLHSIRISASGDCRREG